LPEGLLHICLRVCADVEHETIGIRMTTYVEKRREEKRGEERRGEQRREERRGEEKRSLLNMMLVFYVNFLSLPSSLRHGIHLNHIVAHSLSLYTHVFTTSASK
jgi:hypothetical protein